WRAGHEWRSRNSNQLSSVCIDAEGGNGGAAIIGCVEETFSLHGCGGYFPWIHVSASAVAASQKRRTFIQGQASIGINAESGNRVRKPTIIGVNEIALCYCIYCKPADDEPEPELPHKSGASELFP